MNLAVLGTTFGVIFLAELPDKTALASLVLGTRYRPGYVFAGVAAAFAAHVVLAIVAGSLLGLLPHRVVEVIVAVLFAAGAVLMLRRRDDKENGDMDSDAGLAGSAGTQTSAPRENAQPQQSTAPRAGAVAAARNGFWRVAATSFAVLFVAEFGDLTQLAIANLAARYHQPLTVGIGAVAGLWAVGALAIGGGRQLLRLVPVTWVTRAAAAVMLALAALSLLAAITG